MKQLFQYLNQHWRWIITILTLLLLALAIHSLVKSCEEGGPISISFDSDNSIELTPAQVTHIKKIGKWEFLSMQMEEIVDTTNKHWIMSDDELVRIYHGTIRLGVDMETLADDWFEAQGDTAIVHMPAIMPLNEKFIDEARTQTFYESGSWTNQAREELYRKAERRMKQRLKESNAYQQAEQNGKEQVNALMRSFGFKATKVTFK